MHIEDGHEAFILHLEHVVHVLDKCVARRKSSSALKRLNMRLRPRTRAQPHVTSMRASALEKAANQCPSNSIYLAGYNAFVIMDLSPSNRHSPLTLHFAEPFFHRAGGGTVVSTP